MAANSRSLQNQQRAGTGAATFNESGSSGALSSLAAGELRASLGQVQLLALNAIFEVAQSTGPETRLVVDVVDRLVGSANSASASVDALARAWAGGNACAGDNERGLRRAATGHDAWLQLLVTLADEQALAKRRGFPN